MATEKTQSFIEHLKNSGWKITLRDEQTPLSLEKEMASVYSRLPKEYVDFLRYVKQCENKDSTTWFLCEADFEGKSTSAFKWNEFELQSIDAAKSDELRIKEVGEFWKCHFPIVISVKDGYSYFAITVSEDAEGTIVTGREPEYEEAYPIAESFGELIEKIIRGDLHLA